MTDGDKMLLWNTHCLLENLLQDDRPAVNIPPAWAAELQSLADRCCIAFKRGSTPARTQAQQCDSDCTWYGCGRTCEICAPTAALASPQLASTPSRIGVEICPECDIAGCRHIRAQNAAFKEKP